jgi:hypothetical protein
MAIVIPVISTFDNKGISKAISSFKQLDGAGQKSAFALLNGTKAVNSFGKSVLKIGGIMGGIGGVVGGSLIKAALESQKVSKQTEAIVKATGGAANLSTKQISDLSRAMSVKTGVDDEAIQTSMNLLLTFKAVRNEVGAGNDIFTRASQAALDLGNVFGSTDGAAKQLGKALADPVKGVSALKKAGVDFTDAQRKQIKAFVDSGNILGAQKLILKEVESQVGGTAAATATDFDRMKVAVGNVAEDLGTLLLPAFEAASRFVTETLVPIFQKFSDIVGTQGLGAGFKFLGNEGLKALGKLDGWKDLVFGVVTGVVALNIATGIYTGLQTLATIAMSAFGTAATGTAIAMNAAFFGIPALIGAVVVIVAALALRFKGFRDVIGKMIPVLKFVANFFLDSFVNPIIWGVNQLIKAYNGIPFLSNIPLLTELHIGSDKAKKSVESLGDELTKLKPKLKLGQASIFRKKKTKPTGDDTTVDKAKTALEKYTSALKLFGTETKAAADAVKGITTANMALANATDDVRVAQDKFNKISKGYGAGSKEAAVATRDFADAQRAATRATISLRDATRGVADAQKALDDLKSGKASANAAEDLAFATQKIADAKQSLADAYIQGGDKTITDAAQRLSDAYAEQKDAIDAVRAANDASSPEAIMKAEDDLTLARLDLVDAQNAVKDADQDVIDKQNELHDVISGAATDSQKYKDAQKELTDAQNAERDAVDSLTDAYDKQAKALIDLANAKKGLATSAKATTGKQERSAQATTGIDPTTGLPTGLFGGVDSLMGGLPSIDFSKFVPLMADGGIVNKPTLAMIGESGSEAVIPLSQMGNTGNINITVNTGVGDPVAIGKSVVDALQAYQRRSGALQIKVA